MAQSNKKRSKAPDFQWAEEVLIAEFYVKHRDILDKELKGLQGAERSVTSSKKNRIYEKLQAEINSQTSIHRELTSIRNKLRDMKSLGRSKYQSNMHGTGGGEPEILSVGEQIIVNSDKEKNSSLLEGMSTSYETNVTDFSQPKRSKQGTCKATSTISKAPCDDKENLSQQGDVLESSDEEQYKKESSAFASRNVGKSDMFHQDGQEIVSDESAESEILPCHKSKTTTKKITAKRLHTAEIEEDLSESHDSSQSVSLLQSQQPKKMRLPRNAFERHGITKPTQTSTPQTKKSDSGSKPPSVTDVQSANIEYFCAATEKVKNQKTSIQFWAKHDQLKLDILEKQKDKLTKEITFLTTRNNILLEHRKMDLELKKLEVRKVTAEVYIYEAKVVEHKRQMQQMLKATGDDNDDFTEQSSDDKEYDMSDANASQMASNESTSVAEVISSDVEVGLDGYANEPKEVENVPADKLLIKASSNLQQQGASSYTQYEDFVGHKTFADNIIKEQKWNTNVLIRNAYEYFDEVNAFLKCQMKNVSKDFPIYSSYVKLTKGSDAEFQKVKKAVGYTNKDTDEFTEYILRIHRRMFKGKPLVKSGNKVVAALHYVIGLTWYHMPKKGSVS